MNGWEQQHIRGKLTEKSKNYSNMAFKYSPESTRIYASMNDINKFSVTCPVSPYQ